jgi:WD40 repeat protein
VHGVAFSARGLLATASWDHTAKVWDAAGACLATLTGHTGTVEAVAFAPDWSLLATASGDATVRLWHAATGTHLATLAGHDQTVRAAAFSPNGSLLATASADATVRLWDVASGAQLAILVPLPSAGYMTLLPGGRYKLSGDPGDCLWWAAGLDRLGPDEVHDRFPGIRRLPPGAPVLPR